MSRDLLTVDRVEIADLIARLSRLLDEGRYEDAEAIYIDDVVVHSPRGGELRGIGKVVDYLLQSQVADEHTQHLNSDLVVGIEGDNATVTANQLVYFYRDGQPPHQTSGLRVAYTAARTPEGWRISEARITLAWTQKT
ncbi:MAG: nuclear transport factor 2 family protein [Kibdelosporangium sp.]